MKTAGVILCGGYSRRMGSDKARIELQGETVLSRVFRSMSSVVTPVLVSCRPDQHFDVATLSGHGDDSVAIEVFDAVEDAGP
ncbi:MAG: molybdenum cofactor guanylyltransferase, partial [Phycisphaerae bacterium]